MLCHSQLLANAPRLATTVTIIRDNVAGEVAREGMKESIAANIGRRTAGGDYPTYRASACAGEGTARTEEGTARTEEGTARTEEGTARTTRTARTTCIGN